MFKLLTDSSADLPASYYEENDIGVVNLSCLVDGNVIWGEGIDLDVKWFYQMMKDGGKPTTSQVNPEEAKRFFEKYIDEYKEILYLGFTSGLSGTVQSGRIAAEEVMEEHPDVKITVIDTLCAAGGQGLMVYYANEQKKLGKSMDEVAAYVEANKMNVGHVFTVDDLFDLWRGGRVSKTAAFVGTLASIKPRLIVDAEGKLVVKDKIRGRKKSLVSLVDFMEETETDFKEMNDQMIVINHGDCIEDAQAVADMIKERMGYTNFIINNLGPVIGSHTGPSLVALFYMGKTR